MLLAKTRLQSVFEKYCSERGADLDSLDVPGLIDLFADSHPALRSRGCVREPWQDQLLFQTGNPSGEPCWQLNLTRQLYGRPASQLGFTLFVPHEAAPWPGYTTLWSQDCTDIDEWRAKAHCAWLELVLADDVFERRALSLDFF
jgi:hypothetical protein